jgi:gluconate 2-dehydrogenase gamma chain
MPDLGDRETLYSRRVLLEAGLGIAGAIALCRSATALAVAADAHQSTERRFFSASESRTVEAIVAQIIPTDETPGAREMGVARFIDHGLAGFLAPLAAAFRAGLADFETQYRMRNPGGQEFASLPPVRQIEWLQQVEHTPFFGSLQQLTVLGALTMPQYGGNRDGLGWQLIGFADQHAFVPPFGYYDRDYPGFHARAAEPA